MTAAGALPLLPAGARAAAETPASIPAPSYPPIIGEIETYVTRYEDTLVDLARTHGLGYTEMVTANPGIDPWVPGADVEITLPKAHILPSVERKGLVLNLADQRLYHFMPDGTSVDTAPLGIGDEGWDTPQGETKVVRKKHRPTWYVPKSIREQDPELPAYIRPGPQNPLGEHALYLGWPAYLIHGTNKPLGVGRRVSHGCVRLYPEDIARMFATVPVGTPVRVIDQEVKLARMDGQLWLEVHPNPDQVHEVEQTGTLSPSKPPEFEYQVVTAAGNDQHRIDWDMAQKAAMERRGMPVPILIPASDSEPETTETAAQKN